MAPHDISGVGESSALGRNVFGVRRVVIPVAKMRVPDRRRLGKRLRSELDAVRDLLDRFFAPGAGAGAGAAVEQDDEDGCSRAAKSRKVSFFTERARESKPPDDRERLAGRLASMAAALPDHVVAFLQSRRRVGDAVSGEVEMDDVPSMNDGALFQLKMLLDKFAPEVSTRPKLLLVDKFTAPEVSTPKSRAPPLAASGVSCLSQAQHQELAGARMPPVQEEDEEGNNICGGVSRIAIRDIAEEYGELVSDIGVRLLSPLQRKYVDVAEDEDRYVDICGDASPIVFPAAKTGGSSSSSTSSDSDATSSSTDSDSGSRRSSPEAGEPVPAPEAIIQIAEPENQCAVAVIAITKSPPAPAPTVVLPKECGALPQPPEQAPEAVQIAEPEELKEKCVATGPTTVHPITGGSAPPPAVLPDENDSSFSQPAPEPAAPVAAQIAEPQPQPQEVQTSDLIAMARQEGRRRAMAKARQELLEMERAVQPDERIHPQDMELLGIAAFEHVVSTMRTARTATAPQQQVDDGVAGLRVSPGRPSILQQLGVFLKADSGGEEEDEEDEEEQPPPLAVASDGEDDMDMEIEDGQIL